MTKDNSDIKEKNPIIEVFVGILVLALLLYLRFNDDNPLNRLVNNLQSNYPKLFLLIVAIFGIYLVIRGIKNHKNNQEHLAGYRILSGSLILLLCILLVI